MLRYKFDMDEENYNLLKSHLSARVNDNLEQVGRMSLSSHHISPQSPWLMMNSTRKRVVVYLTLSTPPFFSVSGLGRVDGRLDDASAADGSGKECP